jgi:hypothetical protein
MKRAFMLVLVAACGHSSDATPDASGSGGEDGSVGADGAVHPPGTFGFDGPELGVCDGTFHAPTVLLAEDRLVVGCLASGSQNTIPQVKFFTGAGAPIGEVSLLTSDGLYYKESRLSHHDGKFQVIYEYNCDDNGSWQVGWGWGCIELRELDDTGDQVLAMQFGEIGHNGHPVLDAGPAGELGVGWVSYDDAYFRRLGADRMLTGGPGANLLLGPDPRQSDARSAARTQIAWDGDGYGVFTIIGTHMYFSRVEAGDHIAVSMKDLGSAYSETYSGEFGALSLGGTYFVAYDDLQSVRLVNYDRNGDVVKAVVAQAGAYAQPQLVTAGGRLYVVTEDAGHRGYVTVFDQNLDKIGGSLIGGGLGRTMLYPNLATDGASWVVAYQDGDPGNVKVQRLVAMP